MSEQIELLKTFYAGTWGRYSYKRVPFGLLFAPEVFHRCYKNISEGITSAEVQIEDIIIRGSNDTDHEETLKQVLIKAGSANVRFNEKKCSIGDNEVRYVWHTFSKDWQKQDNDKVNAILSMDTPELMKEL